MKARAGTLCTAMLRAWTAGAGLAGELGGLVDAAVAGPASGDDPGWPLKGSPAAAFSTDPVGAFAGDGAPGHRSLSASDKRRCTAEAGTPR